MAICQGLEGTFLKKVIHNWHSGGGRLYAKSSIKILFNLIYLE
jgi:hypothetical protein